MELKLIIVNYFTNLFYLYHLFLKMINSRYILFGLGYVIKTKIFRKEIPFFGGLVINEKCNLNCCHCRVKNREGVKDLTFREVEKGLGVLYKMGIRSVFIEGGEPFLWKENDKTLNDIVLLAKKIGFKLVSIYTNGTFPITISADLVFVSIDGLKENNNKLRGGGRNIYDSVMKNITESNHEKIIINYTINEQNKDDIEEFCKGILKIKQIKGVFFYFHTPYYGKDNLYLEFDEKKKIIEKIITLKKKRYSILNSYSGLKSVYKNSWKRPTKLCYVYASNELYQCCRSFGNIYACENCGYLAYPEIINVIRLNPESIINALNYLIKN